MTLSARSGFYTASKAREIAIGQSAANNVLLSEVHSIENAIDVAARGGAIEATVSGTEMTGSQEYYDAWKDSYNTGDTNSQLFRFNMNEVVKYFSKLGYRITRRENPDSNRFAWLIEW